MEWVIMIAVVLSIAIGVARQIEINKMNKAKWNYKQRLREYVQNNRDDERQRAAVLAGLEYINASKTDPRKRFTKEMLKNDISAVLGSRATDEFLLRASGINSKDTKDSEASKLTENSIEQRLRKLHSLHDNGLIDDDEYAAKKAELINQI